MNKTSKPKGRVRCPSCGAANPPLSKFCFRCGTRIPAPTPEKPALQAQPVFLGEPTRRSPLPEVEPIVVSPEPLIVPKTRADRKPAPFIVESPPIEVAPPKRVEKPLSTILEELVHRHLDELHRLGTLNDLLRRKSISSQTYAKLEKEVTDSLTNTREETKTRIEESNKMLQTLETQKAQKKAELEELVARYEMKMLPQQKYDEQARSASTEINLLSDSIEWIHHGLASLERAVKLDEMYEALRKKIGSSLQLEEKITPAQAKTGSREAAIKQLYELEILKPLRLIKENEIVTDIQPNGAELIYIDLKEQEALTVEWESPGRQKLFAGLSLPALESTSYKIDLVRTVSVALVDSETYTRLARRGTKPTPAEIHRHAKGKIRHGILSYTSPSPAGYYLVAMNPFDTAQTIHVKYRILQQDQKEG